MYGPTLCSRGPSLVNVCHQVPYDPDKARRQEHHEMLASVAKVTLDVMVRRVLSMNFGKGLNLNLMQINPF